MNRIEIWSKEKYETNVDLMLSGAEESDLSRIAEEAFACLDEDSLGPFVEEELTYDDLPE
jgi:hypothetical protein